MEPFLDFSSAEELPEGITPEALASESVQSFIKTQFDANFEKRFETEAQGLRQTNDALKEEKRKLKGYLDTYKEIDVDEYKRLKELAKNNGDAAKQIEQLEAQNRSMKEQFDNQIATKETEISEAHSLLSMERLTNHVANGISEHNRAFPTVAVREGADRWIKQEAGKVWKQDKDGNFVPMNGERVLVGQKGDIMTYAEWVNSLRADSTFSSLFLSPTGGGAGGDGGGGGRSFNPKDMAGSKEERQAAIAAKFNLPNT